MGGAGKTFALGFSREAAALRYATVGGGKCVALGGVRKLRNTVNGLGGQGFVLRVTEPC